MTARTRNGNSDLDAAIALLVRNQAALVAQHTAFLSHLDEDRKRFDEDRQRFSRIERDLDAIKSLLIKHEEMLQKLPDAIKEKIGFKQ